jgi:hypothetical protein
VGGAVFVESADDNDRGSEVEDRGVDDLMHFVGSDGEDG